MVASIIPIAPRTLPSAFACLLWQLFQQFISFNFVVYTSGIIFDLHSVVVYLPYCMHPSSFSLFTDNKIRYTETAKKHKIALSSTKPKESWSILKIYCSFSATTTIDLFTQRWWWNVDTSSGVDGGNRMGAWCTSKYMLLKRPKISSQCGFWTCLQVQTLKRVLAICEAVG